MKFNRLRKIRGIPFETGAVVAVAICAVIASSAAFAAGGPNLVVNGTFDSGTLAPWTRNTTKGRAGRNGGVGVNEAGASGTWVHGDLASVCGSHAAVIQSYNFQTGNNATTYGNSTDSYIIQSFTVEDVGTYMVSLDCAGRNSSNSSLWDHAESYVRIFKGTDISAEPIFTGAFTPLSYTSFNHYRGRMRIREPGIYTIQVYRPEPMESGNVDKCVVVDNVTFARDDADNLIFNGCFEAATLSTDGKKATVVFHSDANSSTPGYQAGGNVPVGFSCPGWDGSGSCGLSKRNTSWVSNDPLAGMYGLFMQTYHFNTATFSNSTDAVCWQTFTVAAGGTYELSFDYAGRNSGSLYGATMYVRLYKGTDRTATPVYEGSVVPTRKDYYTRFAATVAIADEDVGEYTLEFFQAQPDTATSGGTDKAIAIDNVAFRYMSANLITNGNFELAPANTGWNVTGNAVVYYSRFISNGQWVGWRIPAGRSALVVQTYNYNNNWGDSGDKSVWQVFDVPSAGTYRLSLDYTGRDHSSLYGETAHVRIYAGEGIGGTPVFEGAFTPATSAAFQHYVNYTTFAATGKYTLELFQSRSATPGPGGAQYDSATIIDNVTLLPVAGCKVARWTGAVDADVTKGGNWDGGEVPDADTLVVFAGDFAAQIPSDTTFSCAGVVFAENARLVATQCDWSGLKGVELCGALDLAGHRLILSSLSGSASISSSVAGGVLEVATATVDDFAVNAAISIDGANVRVEKTGSGTFVAKMPQNYSGGTVVKGGTARPLAATVDIDDGFKAFGAGRVSVEDGATFDGCGHYGYGNMCDLAGGTLTSSIQMADTNRVGIGAGTLSATSYVRASNMVFGESGGRTDLGGKTLSVYVSGQLYLCNATITNGTIDVTHGGYLKTVAGKPVDASTVDLKANCAFWLLADMSVRDYEAIYAENYNEGTAALKVYGTFKASEHDYFRGCTMMDGSTIDISSRTTALPLVSVFTNGDNTLKFAEGATTVYIRLGEKRFPGGKVISWDEKPDGIGTVKFRCADEGRQLSFVSKDDGLYATSGLMIIVR